MQWSQHSCLVWYTGRWQSFWELWNCCEMFSESKRLGLQLQGAARPLWWQCTQREGTEQQRNRGILFEKKWKNTPILNEMARHGVGGIFVFQTFSSYPLTNTTYLPSAVLGTLAAHWPSKKVRSAGLLFRHAGPFRGTVPVQSCPINEVNLFETPVHFDSHCILPSCVTFSSLNEDLSK